MRNFAITICVIIIFTALYFISWMWGSDWGMDLDNPGPERLPKGFITLLTYMGLIALSLRSLDWYKKHHERI